MDTKYYVKDGLYDKLEKIIASKKFYPTYITGLSGNGKTEAVLQCASNLKRNLIRVNLNDESEEMDLIGGFRLENGNTVFHKGPVIQAMESGSILLLDEIDLANPSKITCLQSILEGADYHIKKINQRISPAPGFNIIATANTKGQGSETGKFIGANVQNEAFLERFRITIEQEYPDRQKETDILTHHLARMGLSIDEKTTYIISHLTHWADQIRQSFMNDGVDEVISTRRLIGILETYSIFGDIDQSVALCLNRFTKEVKDVFYETYVKTRPVKSATDAKQDFMNNIPDDIQRVMEEINKVI